MILITGATGRIGSHLVKELRKKEKVKILARKKLRMWRVQTAKGDLLDKDSLKEAVEDVDTVYHLAACVDYLAPKDLMYNVNVNGTKNLLDVFNGKIIYLSTTAVLGKKLPYLPADENTIPNPDNYYGKTKLEAEKLILRHGGIVLRATTVYGPGFEEGYFPVISKIENGTMKIIGHGNNLIQYTHVNDLVQGLLLARKGKEGEIYHIAGNEVRTQREIYGMIAGYLGVPAPKGSVSKASALMYANIGVLKHKTRGIKPKIIPEYIKKLAANRTFRINKARKELGYEPKVYYEQGIKEMVELYKKEKKVSK